MYSVFFGRTGVAGEAAFGLKLMHFIILAQDSSSFFPLFGKCAMLHYPRKYVFFFQIGTVAYFFFSFDKWHVDKPLSVNGPLSKIFIWSIYSEI